MTVPASPTLTMTPGAYIHARRKHFGVNLFELSDATELTVVRLRAIEAGARPEAWEAERLGACIYDMFDVLTDLLDGRHIRLCSNCGCHEHDACFDGHENACRWVAEDLCSACADPSTAILAFDPQASQYFTMGDRS